MVWGHGALKNRLSGRKLVRDTRMGGKDVALVKQKQGQHRSEEIQDKGEEGKRHMPGGPGVHPHCPPLSQGLSIPSRLTSV